MSSTSSVESSACSMTSSTKSKVSSSDLNDENDDPLESDIDNDDEDDNLNEKENEEDDDENFNSSNFDSFSEENFDDEDENFQHTMPQTTSGQTQCKVEAKNYDTDDPFNLCDMFNSDADPFDFNHIKSDQNDSGISLNSTNTVKSESLDVKSGGFESDDSDCLFSITKSVSIQSLMTPNGGAVVGSQNKKKVRLTNEQRKKRLKECRKRKKMSVKSDFHENEEDEDDDIEEIDETSSKVVSAAAANANSNVCASSDDELKSMKRSKTSSNLNDNSFTVLFFFEVPLKFF